MKKILSALLVIGMLIIFAAGSAFARDTYVKGYYRSNGTYVQPHYRTSPDNSLFNNYSTKGNVNPYTGSKGYVNPYGSSGTTGRYGNNNLGSNLYGSTLPPMSFGGSLFGNWPIYCII